MTDPAPRARKKRIWVWAWVVLVATGLGGLAAAVGGDAAARCDVAIVGLWFFLAAGAALPVAWVCLLVAALLRRPGKLRWLIRLSVATVLWVGIVLAGYMLLWRPVRQLYDGMNAYHIPPAQVRSLCYRSLLWNPDPHDEFIWMIDIGEPESVPYVLWGLRWMPNPSPDGYMTCTWAHGLQAIETITNNSPGDTREAWQKWYAKNKRRPQMEWWADGFRAMGYPVSASGGDNSVRNLLSVLGRTEWCVREDREWPSVNARRMLDRLDKPQVRVVMAAVARSGTVEERRGLARYAGGLERGEAEPVLTGLLKDSNRSVRLCASGVLCLCRQKWLKHESVPFEHSGNIDSFFAPAGKQVVESLKAIRPGWRELDNLPLSLTLVPARDGGPECILRAEMTISRDHGLVAFTLEGRTPGTDKPVRSTPLVTSSRWHDFRWLYDEGADRLYISMEGYTCLANPRTGEVIWETGFGAGNNRDLFVAGPYLIVRSYDAAVLDASSGEFLACYRFPNDICGRRFSVVDGQLRACDSNNVPYILDAREAE